MLTFVDSFAAALAAATSALPEMSSLSDAQLLAAQSEIGDVRRSVDACAALIAGEIVHRSRRDLGYDGLAQREGARTPQALIQRQTGSTARDAATLASVGVMIRNAITPPESLVADGVSVQEPWLNALGAAVKAGELSVESARSIAAGLGKPNREATIGALELTTAVLGLLALAQVPGATADQLFRLAREARDDLDEAGIADREREIHEQRSVHRSRRPSGLYQYTIVPDIESAAFWDSVYDSATSPRRGGPRFTDPAEQGRYDSISADERTLTQFTHDAFTALMTIAVSTDTPARRKIIGRRVPAVRVLVTATALTSRMGHGRIEGSDLPVSIQTVERIACTNGTIDITFDATGQALDVGREQRSFPEKQRIALAVRDGGCMFGDCDRTPDWCEAHHILQWKRDSGGTSVRNGILLCRYHHLLLHNNGWEISVDDDGYWLIPPASVDPTRTPRPMRSKSAALRDLRNLRQVG